MRDLPDNLLKKSELTACSCAFGVVADAPRRSTPSAARCAVRGFEALLRWAHPQRGLLTPAEFIPVAEDGVIVAIGDWVLREAGAQMAAWCRASRRAVPP